MEVFISECIPIIRIKGAMIGMPESSCVGVWFILYSSREQITSVD